MMEQEKGQAGRAPQAKPRGWLARALGLGGRAPEPPREFDFKDMQRALDSLAARGQPGE